MNIGDNDTNTFLYSEELPASDSLESPDNFTLNGSQLNTSEFEYEYILDSPSIRISLYVAYTVVFCLGFIGNLTVMLVMALHWRMRSVTRFCMGNLAFANFCMAIFCVYQNVSAFVQHNWVFGLFLCKMYYFISSVSHTASILILVVVSIERYLSIVHPVRFRQMLKIQQLRCLIAGVWLLSMLISSPRLYYITTFEAPLFEPSTSSTEVICAPVHIFYSSKLVDLTYFVLLFFLPLLIMSALYMRIVKIICQSSAGLQSASDGIISYGDSAGSPYLSVHYRNSIPPAPQNSVMPDCSAEVNQVTIIERTARSNGGHEGRNSTGPRAESDSRNLRNEPIERNSIGSSAAGNIIGRQDEGALGLRRVERLHQKRVIAISVTRVKDKRRGQLLRSRKAAIRILIAVVITFALCNFPYHLRKMCQYFIPGFNIHSAFNQILTPVTFLLMYTNCALNPILYGFMSKNFRASLIELLRLPLRRPNSVRVRRRMSF